MALTIDSTVTLSSGHKMPLLGFGVFQNSDAKPSTLEAFKAGYRYVQFYEAEYFILFDTYITLSHVDSAQMYGNEAQVADAVRESGLDRGDVFISAYILFLSLNPHLKFLCLATKCFSRTHGYESTKKGVDDSLAKMKFGLLYSLCLRKSNC